MNSNKEQREGLAKVLDNLATAIFVAVIIGGFVDQKIDVATILMLVALGAVLLASGFYMRKGNSNGS